MNPGARGALAGLLLVVVAVLAAMAVGRAGDEGVCGLLAVPPGFDVRCERDALGSRLVVTDPSAAYPFERLTLRELSRARDGLAWTRPRRWLERQLTLDTRALTTGLEELRREAEEPVLATLLEGLARLFDRLGGVALTACDHRRTRTGQRLLACRFGRDPLELHLQLRLIALGERRFAVNITTLDRRRLRRFEAIANGFRGTAS